MTFPETRWVCSDCRKTTVLPASYDFCICSECSKPMSIYGGSSTRKQIRHLIQCACFECRKTFKKPVSLEECVCPDCRGPMTRMSRTFKAPKQEDLKQWRKVQANISS
jgi:hypothetical protein